MFTACALWGLMSPVGKDAMTHGIDGITMVNFRVLGGCVLFWLTALVMRWRGAARSRAAKAAAKNRSREATTAEAPANGAPTSAAPSAVETATDHVSLRDKLLLAGAAVFGLVTNQCCFTIGLSLTSPANASIVTTSMPVFAMVLSAIILHEPITGKKAGGVAMGFAGAVMLILTSAGADSDKVGNLAGDLLCLGAQCSYALYLSLFNPLVRRHSAITVNRWMFTWASLLIVPLSLPHVVATLSQADIPPRVWAEVAYVVVMCTYLGYILVMIGQKTLRPTVVSVYNYVQPVVAVSVSLAAGIGVFTWSQAVAMLLIFGGVWLVTKSKSRRDMGLDPLRK